MRQKDPLWKQTLHKIKKRIQEEYKVGDYLPGDIELMNYYDVSRITVRRALDELTKQGVIKRERGRGTVVIDQEERLQTIVQSSLIDFKEHTMRSRHVDGLSYQVVDDDDILVFFGLSEPTVLLKVLRSSTKKNRKIARYTTYINPNAPLTIEDDFSGSLYHLLETKELKVTHFIETLKASIATLEEQTYFEANNSIPIITRYRKAYSANMPVEYSINQYNGEEFSMIVENSRMNGY